MQNTTIHSPLPDTPTHNKHAVAVLGVPYDLANQVNEYIDREWKNKFILHRFYDSHNIISSPAECRDLFGPRADEICRLHIIEDTTQDIQIYNTLTWLGLAGVFVAGALLVDGSKPATNQATPNHTKPAHPIPNQSNPIQSKTNGG